MPTRLGYRPRKRRQPRIVVVCDVSDSVREAATFFLEFTAVCQGLVDQTRSFVFVSDVREVTKALAGGRAEAAITQMLGDLRTSDTNSNYGRAFRAFEKNHLRAVDRRTTVVILGDGRTNYHDPAADVISRLRERARAVIWLCPEGRSSWSSGDSAMERYARECSKVLEVKCARDLELAARTILAWQRP